MAPESFGWRFLTELRRLGGSTGTWPPAAVGALEQADRRRFIELLEKASPRASSPLAVAAHTAEPETLARKAMTHAAGHDMLSTLALLLGVGEAGSREAG